MTKSWKHCGKRRNCSFWAISSFVTLFSKSCLLQRLQKVSIWGKGLMLKIPQSIEFQMFLYCAVSKWVCFWVNVGLVILLCIPSISEFLVVSPSIQALHVYRVLETTRASVISWLLSIDWNTWCGGQIQ